MFHLPKEPKKPKPLPVPKLKPMTEPAPKKEHMTVNLVYASWQRKRLKTFCNLLGLKLGEFVFEAIENEIDARLDAMTEDQRDHTKSILRRFKAQ